MDGRIAEMQENLLKVYEDIIAIIPKISERHWKIIDDTFKKFEEEILNRKKDLQSKYENVIIAGETSAGKTSLLNELLGEKLFRVSNNASTDKIYRVHNSDALKLIYTTRDGKVIRNASFPSVNSLKTDLQQSCLKGYLIVDIFLPIQKLKENVVLVDTPGIGTNEEHTEILLSYLAHAVAFIFVVNVANAGGFQKGRLLDIFKHIQKRLPEMPCFDPTDVLFVMNKWDRVDRSEREEIIQNANRVLFDAWPYVSMAESNTFHLSLKEIKKDRDSTGYNAEEFHRFNEKLKILIESHAGKRFWDHKGYAEDWVEMSTSTLMTTLKFQEKKNEVEQMISVVKNEDKNFSEEVNEFSTLLDCKAEFLANECFKHMSSKDLEERLVKKTAAKKLNYKRKVYSSFIKELESWCAGKDVEEVMNIIDLKMKNAYEVAEKKFQHVNTLLTGQHLVFPSTRFNSTGIVKNFLEIFPKATSFQIKTKSTFSWIFSSSSSKESHLRSIIGKILEECSIVILMRCFKCLMILHFFPKIDFLLKTFIKRYNCLGKELESLQKEPKLTKEEVEKLRSIVNDLNRVDAEIKQLP